jgi:hypothetical protein
MSIAAAPLVAVAEAEGEPAVSEAPASGQRYLAEQVRKGIDKVVVVPGASSAEKEIKGTYEEVTPGLYGGMAQGSALGTPTMQVGGVSVSTPIPILTLPGMIVGGLSGSIKRARQEFLDALTEELADATDQPLTNEKLARYVFQNLRSLPQPGAGLIAATVAIPEDADAVLYVRVANVSIDVDGDEGVLTTAGKLTLERKSDGTSLFERTVFYQDRAALSEWVDNDHQLFVDYANFALYYLGRELAAGSFAGVNNVDAARPVESASVAVARKNAWLGTSKSLLPTLAWQPTEEGNAVAAATGSEPGYDIEIYDAHRLVYANSGIRGTEHVLVEPLEACGEYRWSVRPSYSVDGYLRFGGWMRQAPDADSPAVDGIVGKDAAKAPAYLQGFASLSVNCRAK